MQNMQTICERHGRIENSTKPKVASTEGNEMETACNEIVADLLEKKGSSSKSNSVSLQGYVDLGLPSGTLWKATNEYGYYDYDSAVNKYGDKLPTREQWEELKNYCTWQWTGKGYKVVSDNGKFIVLPAAGSRYCTGSIGSVGSVGVYWSSTPSDSKNAWVLSFCSDSVDMFSFYGHCNGLSVRLVHNP